MYESEVARDAAVLQEASLELISTFIVTRFLKCFDDAVLTRDKHIEVRQCLLLVSGITDTSNIISLKSF